MARRVSVLGVMVEYVPERKTRESVLGVMVEYVPERESRASVLGTMVEYYPGELVSLVQDSGGIPSEEASGTPEVITTVTLYPTGIASEEAFGSGAAGLGGLRVSFVSTQYDLPTTPSNFRSTALSVSIHQPLLLGGNWIDDYSDELTAYSQTKSADMYYESAQMTLTLHNFDLTDWLLNGLGRHIVVRSPSQRVIWEGFIDFMTITYGGKRYEVGALSEIGNRVYVNYTPVYISSATGGVVRDTATESPLVNDLTSQARYGIIEKNLSAGECIVTPTQNEANRFRDEFLIENAYHKIQGSYSFGSGGEAATVALECFGYWKWLDFYVYNYRTSGSLGWNTLTAKLQAVLAANPNTFIFSTDYTKLETNLAITQKQEANNRTGLTIVKGIATAGDPTGTRWLWGIGENRVAYYKHIPSEIVYEYKVNDNEQRLTVFGSDAIIDPWDIEPGTWYMTHDVFTPILVPSLYSLGSAAFIESIKFTMPYNFDLTEGKMSRISQMLAMKGLGAI